MSENSEQAENLLITNGRLVTWGETSELISNGALLLQDGRIADMGDSADLRARYPDVKELDARDQLVMPGNICAHTHFYGAFARGMGIPGPLMKDFPDILERLWWRLDRALLDVDVEYSALVSLVDAILSGEGEDRNPVDLGVPQSGEQVRRAGTGDGETGRRPPGQLGERRGGERGGALVSNANVREAAVLFGAPECIGESEIRVADHAKDVHEWKQPGIDLQLNGLAVRYSILE